MSFSLPLAPFARSSGTSPVFTYTGDPEPHLLSDPDSLYAHGSIHGLSRGEARGWQGHWVARQLVFRVLRIYVSIAYRRHPTRLEDTVCISVPELVVNERRRRWFVGSRWKSTTHTRYPSSTAAPRPPADNENVSSSVSGGRHR